MKTKVRVRVYDIEWDTDGKKVRLPQRFALDLDICDIEDEIHAEGDIKGTIEGQIENHMDEKYGFCHNGFKWCFI